MSDPASVEELTGCTCLQLRKLTRKVTQIYDLALEGVGLTSTQFSVLAYLSLKTDLSMAELAGRLLMDPTTLTRVLRPLEREGDVEVLSSREDRRRRAVVITKKGRRRFAAALPLWRQAQTDVRALLGRQNLGALNAALSTSLSRIESR